jgi:hypothetical protein
MRSGEVAGGRIAVRVFSASCAMWLALRFLPGAAVPGVASHLSVVQASPSPVRGVWEVHGRPAPAEDPSGFFRAPEIVAALARLDGRVAAANAALALAARDVAEKIEPFPEEETTTLRVSGVVVPFYGVDGVRLARAREDAAERPWLALQAVRQCIDASLSEPEEGILVADAARRRELTRLLRNTEGALEDQETAVLRALDEFRAEGLAAAARAQGPFRRHGTGRTLELVLAAWLGASLREALRRRPALVAPEISLTFAPVLALAVHFALEGSGALPADPVRGVPLAFLPLAFGLGYGCSALLVVVSRLDRLVRGEEPAPAPRPVVAPAAPRPGPPPLPRAGDAARPRPRTERELPEGRLPFHPRKWPDAR